MKNLKLKLKFFVLGSALFCLILALSPCLGEIVITIQVSPQTLNLQNENGEVVTVHTDIAYSTVAGVSVDLNGVDIDYWKSDNRGFFVAKFVIEDIKKLPELVVGGPNTMTLYGYTKEGESFMGETVVLVIDVEPTGKGGRK